MVKKTIIVDCKGHMLGRIASVMAKELLNGQHIVAVRCEELNISGSLYRNKLKYQRFLRLRMNSNPRRGPFHHRSPCKILWRTVRGMIPHKTAKGAIALNRLKSFVGIPAPYNKKKRVVVPDAIKCLRMKPERRFCRLGDLATKVGWKHDSLIKRLEEQRKERSNKYYEAKKNHLAKTAVSREFANSRLLEDQRKLLQECGQL